MMTEPASGLPVGGDLKPHVGAKAELGLEPNQLGQLDAIPDLDLRVARGRRALNRITDDFLGHGGELLFHINLRMSHTLWRPRPTTSEPPRTALSVCV